MSLSLRLIPQRLKALSFGVVDGTAEAVPLQNKPQVLRLRLRMTFSRGMAIVRVIEVMIRSSRRMDGCALASHRAETGRRESGFGAASSSIAGFLRSAQDDICSWNGGCWTGDLCDPREALWVRLRRGFRQTAGSFTSLRTGSSAAPQDDICEGGWRLFDRWTTAIRSLERPSFR